MIGPQTPRDAIRRSREFCEGLDKARAIRVSLALSFALMVVMGMGVALTVDDDGYRESWEPPDNNLDDYTQISGDVNIGDPESEITNDTAADGNWSLAQEDAYNDASGGEYGVLELDRRLPVDENESFILNVSMRVNSPPISGPANVEGYILLTSSNGETIRLGWSGVEGSGPNVYADGSIVTSAQGTDFGEGNWHNVSFQADFENGTIEAYDQDDDSLDFTTGITGTFSSGNVTVQYVADTRNGFTDSGSDLSQWWDGVDLQIDLQTKISGYVVDSNGNGLEDAVVTANNTSAAYVTGSDGFYELIVPAGTYEVTAEKSDFTTESINVTVDEAETLDNQNITLFSDRELNIQTDTHLCWGESADYQVFEVLSDKPGAERNDITDEANVSSSDEDVLAVGETAETITATSNQTVNQQVDLTATHNNSTVTKQVFVGSLTVDNVDKLENSLEMLVALWGNTGCLRDGSGDDAPGGTQLTMLWIFASLSAAIVVTRFSTTFGGIGAFAVVMTMGWFIGGVGEGMIMLTWAFGMFLGLNVATNFQSFKR